MSDAPLILASSSKTRADLLRAAGVSFVIERPDIDEEAAKEGLRAQTLTPAGQAEALAELKALSVARHKPGFVIGADQMLALGDRVFDKPRDRTQAAEHLRLLRGRTHVLHTAVVVAKDGAALWRHLSAPALTMRAFSDAFATRYLDEAGEAALAGVGAYQVEGRGAQLFESIDGDFFSILGLPLLPLLAFLRQHELAMT